MYIGNSQGVLTRWQKFDTSKPSVIAKIYWLDGKNLGGLLKMIELDVYTRLEPFWNNKDLAQLDCLKT